MLEEELGFEGGGGRRGRREGGGGEVEGAGGEVERGGEGGGGGVEGGGAGVDGGGGGESSSSSRTGHTAFVIRHVLIDLGIYCMFFIIVAIMVVYEVGKGH